MMHRVPNVISISSDEDEEEKTNQKATKVDEVSLIAIDRKRKKSNDNTIENGLFMIVVQENGSLAEVTTRYENPLYMNGTETSKPSNKQKENTTTPLIDLLSEEEEIIFRPVTLSPKAKRIKPTHVTSGTTKRHKPNNFNVVDDLPIIAINENNIYDENSVKERNKNCLILPQLLATNRSPVSVVSIMNNNLNSKHTGLNNAKDALRIEGSDISAARAPKTLLNVIHEENLSDTMVIDNNIEDPSHDKNDGDDSASLSDTDNYNSVLNSKSLDKSSEANLQRFKSFLRLCSNKITEDKTKKTFREKHKKFLKLYKAADDFVSKNEFQKTLCNVIDVVKKSTISYEVVNEIMKIYNILKEHKKEHARSADEKGKLDHLYELLKQFTDKIKTLEVVEVDYDAEDNSAYCQLQTYRAKAAKLYDLICVREKKSKYQDRMMYAKLDFDRSSYQAINIAINKKFKNNSVFPTFFDLDRLIRKTVKSNNIEISEISLKEEIKTCFVLLGELLQRRRRHDLMDSLTDFVDPKAIDPATKDPVMDRILLEHKRVAMQKINEICEKYSKIQGSGVEPALSSDPDDSNIDMRSSDEENCNN